MAMGSEGGEGGKPEVARKEFLCPVCRQGGLEILEEAVRHCQPAPSSKEETGSEDNVSEASKSTKEEIIAQIKKLKEKEHVHGAPNGHQPRRSAADSRNP